MSKPCFLWLPRSRARLESSQTWKVLVCFKKANVIPLLKNIGLEKEELKNYHPASNLPFLSKTLEKIVSTCLEVHLHAVSTTSYNPPIAQDLVLWRPSYVYTVTLLQPWITKCKVVLVMMDLSAAFDVLGHGMNSLCSLPSSKRHTTFSSKLVTKPQRQFQLWETLGYNFIVGW